jgi:hypothetical protein
MSDHGTPRCWRSSWRPRPGWRASIWPKATDLLDERYRLGEALGG